MANGASSRRSRDLARLIRWAIVASGTRNARAIWAVVRPPTARRVRATWLGRDSVGVTAQQQQRDRVVDDGGPIALVGAGGDDLVGRRPQLVEALALGPGPLGPHLIDQPTGGHGGQPGVRAVGNALRRPLLVRRQQGLLQRVLGGVEVAVPPHQGREDLWRVGPPQVLGELVRAHRSRLTDRRRPPTSPAAARRCRRVGRSGPRSPRPAPGWRSRSGRSRPAAPWSRRTGPR